MVQGGFLKLAILSSAIRDHVPGSGAMLQMRADDEDTV
jgi:hypothetical protein